LSLSVTILDGSDPYRIIEALQGEITLESINRRLSDRELGTPYNQSQRIVIWFDFVKGGTGFGLVFVHDLTFDLTKLAMP